MVAAYTSGILRIWKEISMLLCRFSLGSPPTFGRNQHLGLGIDWIDSVSVSNGCDFFLLETPFQTFRLPDELRFSSCGILPGRIPEISWEFQCLVLLSLFGNDFGEDENVGFLVIGHNTDRGTTALVFCRLSFTRAVAVSWRWTNKIKHNGNIFYGTWHMYGLYVFPDLSVNPSPRWSPGGASISRSHWTKDAVL